jgi:hypothetical protein
MEGRPWIVRDGGAYWKITVGSDGGKVVDIDDIRLRMEENKVG